LKHFFTQVQKKAAQKERLCYKDFTYSNLRSKPKPRNS
jgi:hypothetical protein